VSKAREDGTDLYGVLVYVNLVYCIWETVKLFSPAWIFLILHHILKWGEKQEKSNGNRLVHCVVFVVVELH